MSEPIGPGDFVEYVGPASTVFPSPGAVDQVTAVDPAYTLTCSCGSRAILSVQSRPRQWWCVNMWRPIYRPKADLIEALLAPQPARQAPAQAQEIAS